MTIGIYAIINTVNNKRYIGKSSKIEHRLWSHFNAMSKDAPSKKVVNRHLTQAWKKYGKDAFTTEILETFEQVDEALMSDRELYWMDFYKTCDREYGYNLRRDSSTRMTVHDETKELIRVNNTGENNPNYGNRWNDDQKLHMSKLAKARWKSGKSYTDETRRKHSENATQFWANNPDIKARMAKKVAEATTKYCFRRIDAYTGEVLQYYDNMAEVMEHHPDFFKIAIYNVCNGYKNSYRGFKWTKELKNDKESEAMDL